MENLSFWKGENVVKIKLYFKIELNLVIQLHLGSAFLLLQKSIISVSKYPSVLE